MEHMKNANAYILQIYSFSLKWILVNKKWVDLQVIKKKKLNSDKTHTLIIHVSN